MTKRGLGLAMETAALPARAPLPPERVVPRVPSRSLLGERGELIIEHAGREYKLRQTRTGKLILTA